MYLIMGHFLLFGFIIGVRGVIWADLLKHLNISESRFGIAQLLSYMIAAVLLARYTRIAHHISSKSIMLIGLGISVVGLVALATSTSFWWFLPSLLLLGTGTSSMDGALTQASIDWEHAAQRRRMNLMHSGFSAGAVLGALVSGSALGGGWSYSYVLFALAFLCFVALAATAPARYPPTARMDSVLERGTWRTVLGHATIRSLVLICLVSVVVESMIFVWSVIYLRDELHAPAVVGGVGFALFNGAMFVGRMLNASLVARYGVRTSLILSGIGLILAAVLLLLAHQVVLAIAAFGLLGLGVAGIFPTIVGAAGDILPGRSGLLTGVIMSSSYAAFMITPPIVGWIAELNSLRAAMLLILVCGAVLLFLAIRLPHFTTSENHN